MFLGRISCCLGDVTQSLSHCSQHDVDRLREERQRWVPYIPLHLICMFQNVFFSLSLSLTVSLSLYHSLFLCLTLSHYVSCCFSLAFSFSVFLYHALILALIPPPSLFMCILAQTPLGAVMQGMQTSCRLQ